ncbi:MAG: hypothetical protein IJ268_04625 [Proteobacteria bacterium]|nr:hypothetical protein [Pseudomonadota bacterium]
MKLKPLFMLLSSILLSGLVGCSEPEISIVLKDYCDHEIDECGGSAKYQTKAECDKYHKDLLNNTAGGNGSNCKSNIEDFFIALMENQISHACDFNFFQSIADSEDEQMQTATQTVLQCFQDNDVTIDVNAFIGGL